MPGDARKIVHIPIPTYDEALASRPQSSNTNRGPSQVSDDAERQNLLLPPGPVDPTRSPRPSRLQRHLDSHGTYQSPHVESNRSSYESTFTSPAVSSEFSDSSDSTSSVRHAMEDMDMDDPSSSSSRPPNSYVTRIRLPKALAALRETLSGVSLPWQSRDRNPLYHHLSASIEPVRDRVDLFFKARVPWPIIFRLVGLFIIITFIYGLVVFKVLGPERIMGGLQYVPDSVRGFVQTNIDPKNIEKYLYEFTYDDHIAGTKGDYFLADRVQELFFNAKLDRVYADDYEVYLNYPRAEGRRVAIISPPELAWEAQLEEDKIPGMETRHQSLVFHGHSKSDNVTGHLIYANYGAREDFRRLENAGISLNGSIALVRYYGTQGDRALKVKAAELAGAAGCLIYSDPSDDGSVKGQTWPDGPWRPADSVQRGAVSLMSWVVGDVLTPGWASTKGADRISVAAAAALVNIPSLPLSWRDAKVLLSSLQGKGQRVWPEWQAGDDPEKLEFWTGDASSPTVHLSNLQDSNEKQPIRNIIGTIQGIETPEKAVYIGNHRDAWCFGAVDPNSGTAVLLEVVRVFGKLMELGWRPRRTIVFASWDAEEYNLIGSTEHVEERLDFLRENGVAYINVDSAVSGPNFAAAASPLFIRPLTRVLDRVTDPNANKTLLELWKDRGTVLEGLGAGSDYVAFQDLAGTSSIDFGFRGEDGAYPYHSCYDNFDWMKDIADPDFIYHGAAAEVMALLILELADEPIIGFNFTFYAHEVKRYVNQLGDDISKLASQYDGAKSINLQHLHESADAFVQNAVEFMKFEDDWLDTVGSVMMENRETAIHRVSHNTRMSNFETHLLDLPYEDDPRHGHGGVPGREQFKHIIFGPQLWDGYEESYFPHVRDMLEFRDWDRAQDYVELVAMILGRSARKLLF